MTEVLRGKQEPSKKSLGEEYHFFTIARFGPDSIVILSSLTVGAIFLFVFGFLYLSALTAVTVAIILSVESMEVIHLGLPEKRLIVGAKCKVLVGTTSSKRGVVRVFDVSGGRLEPELWSAESESPIEEGIIARVKEIKSIILQIERDLQS